MRKRLLVTVLLIFCLVLATTSAALAASWKYITQNTSAAYYFDTESVRYLTPSDETFIEVWLLGAYKTTQSDGAKTFKQKIWLKLDRKAYAVRAEYRYDNDGKAIKSLEQRGSWRDFIPGSTGEEFYDAVKAYVEKYR